MDPLDPLWFGFVGVVVFGGLIGSGIAGFKLLSDRFSPPKRSLPPQQNTPKEALPSASLIERNASAHERANQLLERLCELAEEQLQEIKATRHKLGDGLQRVHEAVSEDISASEERTERRISELRRDVGEIRSRLPSQGAE